MLYIFENNTGDNQIHELVVRGKTFREKPQRALSWMPTIDMV